MDRIKTYLICGFILITACHQKRDNERQANAYKYGIAYNLIRKANQIDSLPSNWVLINDAITIRSSQNFRWENPLKDKLLADSLPFYGGKEILIESHRIREINSYYTGRMGLFNGGDIGEQIPTPQAIEQIINYDLSGKVIAIKYYGQDLDNVHCSKYTLHYEELMKSYRQGIYIPLCPDSVWDK